MKLGNTHITLSKMSQMDIDMWGKTFFKRLPVFGKQTRPESRITMLAIAGYRLLIFSR